MPICWPFFESCHAWRLLSPSSIDLLLDLYAAAAVLAALAFLRPASAAWAWWLLLALVCVQVLIVAQDYRLRANQHYMAVWTTLVFLLVRGKRATLPLLIVSFYFWAGILKLDPDWLSGAALSGRRPLFIPEPLVPAACAYVLLLELVMIFGLLARSRVLFYGAMAQVVLFHVCSWPVVGAFYPIVMFAILTIFPLMRLLPAPLSTRRHGMAAPAAVLVVFAFLQIAHHLFPGDTAITGEGRLFALHMLDASVACRGRAIEHRRDGSSRERTLSTVVPVRIHCDPIVFWNLARELCRRGSADPQFANLDFLVQSRRTAQPPTELRTVVSIEDFCTSGTTYEVWRHNAWILPVQRAT
ncbi:MAG TPA: hypothetical protein VEL28_14835 [Candidatus Binatia bacterium]|nr:hypothetical protein [Candidatus Binatia bacterium]